MFCAFLHVRLHFSYYGKVSKFPPGGSACYPFGLNGPDERCQRGGERESKRVEREGGEREQEGGEGGERERERAYL